MEHDVATIISETLHVPGSALSMQTRITDLVQDSLDIVELIAVLSSTYGLDIDSSHLAGMRTVGDIVRYVTAHARRGRKRERLKTF